MTALRQRVEMRRKAMTGKQTVEVKKEDPDAAPKLDLSGGNEGGEKLMPGQRKNPPKEKENKMSDVVLAAMIDSHKKKEAEEVDGWDDND